MDSTSKPEPGIAKITCELLKQMADMQATLSKCFSEINELKQQQRTHRSRSEGPKREQIPVRHEICFYHRKFGEKANRCLTPCNYGKKATEN